MFINLESSTKIKWCLKMELVEVKDCDDIPFAATSVFYVVIHHKRSRERWRDTSLYGSLKYSLVLLRENPNQSVGPRNLAGGDIWKHFKTVKFCREASVSALAQGPQRLPFTNGNCSLEPGVAFWYFYLLSTESLSLSHWRLNCPQPPFH
jgi:hypothetical protein